MGGARSLRSTDPDQRDKKGDVLSASSRILQCDSFSNKQILLKREDVEIAVNEQRS